MGIVFLITSLVVVISPGPGALLTVAAGLSGGARAAAVTALGCTLGIVPHLLAAVTGLAALLHASATSFEVLRYAGVAYLLYMGWATWRSPAALEVRADARARSNGGRIAEAMLVNLLNPKLSLFFLTFLPQFIAPGEAQPAERMAQLSLVFMAMTLVVFAGYGVFAARFRDQVLRRPSVLLWMRRSFAAAFVALGGKLALMQR
ncbi:MAG: LysE family translocator [Gammaproteobacteria bacterium]|nr:LysE family translocator [Gammaproteobacteria bacterium]MBU1507260.1 LysE family translocator [Gammaproteobacteria bacterium]MBU2123478.1 LysE family translocator [Gammaproteobacteria bacterium]MBU2171135.1 LysE family translocator [Gammaproteobacteria bacterium]MBU2201709.1 LysE family translocator [Gammaproteobacteria bacterium]